MSKLKIAGERKALSVPISLRPKHKLMLDELEKVFCKNRSKIIQQLIEETYIKNFSETHRLEDLDGTRTTF